MIEGAFRTKSNICDGTFLENNERLKTVDFIHEKGQS